MTELWDFVSKHSVRGTCKCGKCADQPAKDIQPNSEHTSDVIFFNVALVGEPDVAEFKRLIKFHKGEFCEMDLLDGGEHSYLQVGGWFGDQGAALQLMGLGALLSVWKLQTPRMLPGLSDELVMQMAGSGMVSIQADGPE